MAVFGTRGEGRRDILPREIELAENEREGYKPGIYRVTHLSRYAYVRRYVRVRDRRWKVKEKEKSARSRLSEPLQLRARKAGINDLFCARKERGLVALITAASFVISR